MKSFIIIGKSFRTKKLINDKFRLKDFQLNMGNILELRTNFKKFINF